MYTIIQIVYNCKIVCHYQQLAGYLIFPIHCWIYNKLRLVIRLTFLGSLYFGFTLDSVLKIKKSETIINIASFSIIFQSIAVKFSSFVGPFTLKAPDIF